MKRIVLVILFLFAVVWGWNTIGEGLTPILRAENTGQRVASESGQDFDQMVSVLAQANGYADLSVQTTNSLPTNLVRRYRPAGFSFEYLFTCLKTGQYILYNRTLKTFLELSQMYAARLKATGYFVYALRKIII